MAFFLSFGSFRTDDELRKFLSMYRGKNFVKTHRRDTKRFDLGCSIHILLAREYAYIQIICVLYVLCINHLFLVPICLCRFSNQTQPYNSTLIMQYIDSNKANIVYTEIIHFTHQLLRSSTTDTCVLYLSTHEDCVYIVLTYVAYST